MLGKVKRWAATKVAVKELKGADMKEVLDWLKRNKALVGLIGSAIFGLLQLHPEWVTAQQIVGFLSGVLIGAGILDKDEVAAIKQGRLPPTLITGPASVVNGQVKLDTDPEPVKLDTGK